jgi:uncharacterized damage-inducible protein DinB
MAPRQVQTMAAYNRWMNDRLYGVYSGMTDSERKQDRKAFFGSIHGTLNHLLVGDKIWMSRFIAKRIPFRIIFMFSQLRKYEESG